MSQDSVQGEDQSQVSDMKQSGEAHQLSIAQIIGATIGLIGLIILLYGVLGHPDLRRSDNINMDLWWGLLMIVFGIIMTGGGYLSSRRRALHRS
jgi:drug/metabolite transporter (DMT)-like permease